MWIMRVLNLVFDVSLLKKLKNMIDDLICFNLISRV